VTPLLAVVAGVAGWALVDGDLTASDPLRDNGFGDFHRCGVAALPCGFAARLGAVALAADLGERGPADRTEQLGLRLAWYSHLWGKTNWAVALESGASTLTTVDLTALGSVTLVVLISTIALCVLLLLKDRMGALQLVAASVGAGILTTSIKNYIDRPRPEVVTQLIQVSGLSYPSGHSLAAASLYLTVAILVCRHLQRTQHQIAILAMTAGIILLVGTSRIYLGVHYPSDVASGISLGAAWALLLAGCFSFFPNPKVARRGQGSSAADSIVTPEHS